MTGQIHFSSVTYRFWPVKLYKIITLRTIYPKKFLLRAYSSLKHSLSTTVLVAFHPGFQIKVPNPGLNWNLEVLVFVEREGWGQTNPHIKDENQKQTQPTYDARWFFFFFFFFFRNLY